MRKITKTDTCWMCRRNNEDLDNFFDFSYEEAKEINKLRWRDAGDYEAIICGQCEGLIRMMASEASEEHYEFLKENGEFDIHIIKSKEESE